MIFSEVLYTSTRRTHPSNRGTTTLILKLWLPGSCLRGAHRLFVSHFILLEFYVDRTILFRMDRPRPWILTEAAWWHNVMHEHRWMSTDKPSDEVRQPRTDICSNFQSFLSCAQRWCHKPLESIALEAPSDEIESWNTMTPEIRFTIYPQMDDSPKEIRIGKRWATLQTIRKRPNTAWPNLEH